MLALPQPESLHLEDDGVLLEEILDEGSVNVRQLGDSQRVGEYNRVFIYSNYSHLLQTLHRTKDQPLLKMPPPRKRISSSSRTSKYSRFLWSQMHPKRMFKVIIASRKVY